MKKRNIIKKVITLTISSLILAACATPPYLQANQRIDQTSRQIAADRIADNLAAPPVINRPGFYIDTHPLTLAKEPAWMRRSVTLQAQNMPLDELVARLLEIAM